MPHVVGVAETIITITTIRREAPMALYAIDGENQMRETLSEKIERLEQEISDLKDDVENEKQRADEAFDESESISKELSEANERISELEDEVSTMRPGNDEEDTALYLIGEIRASYERLNLGVLSEIDNIIKHTNELLELHL